MNVQSAWFILCWSIQPRNRYRHHNPCSRFLPTTTMSIPHLRRIRLHRDPRMSPLRSQQTVTRTASHSTVLRFSHPSIQWATRMVL
ncbi:hypothetical protein DPMN_047944 [Dreissena polymorpha]|uniref:Uncharacterized protein n=1 Tax=Dreissena polymorpha TaxID=45954 RepID=A0A9D4D900_DREPO|nr:hypothetical protein DPMN_047944 [Dreissena polymorpha]